jgi:hypothetical protein
VLGRVLAWLFLVGRVVWFVGLFVRHWEFYIGSVNLVALVIFVGVCGAFVTGAVALIGQHERSRTAWVATLLPVQVLASDVLRGFEVGET